MSEQPTSQTPGASYGEALRREWVATSEFLWTAPSERSPARTLSQSNVYYSGGSSFPGFILENEIETARTEHRHPPQTTSAAGVTGAASDALESPVAAHRKELPPLVYNDDLAPLEDADE